MIKEFDEMMSDIDAVIKPRLTELTCDVIKSCFPKVMRVSDWLYDLADFGKGSIRMDVIVTERGDVVLTSMSWKGDKNE